MTQRRAADARQIEIGDALTAEAGRLPDAQARSTRSSKPWALLEIAYPAT
jgi:hypothetical protein